MFYSRRYTVAVNKRTRTKTTKIARTGTSVKPAIDITWFYMFQRKIHLILLIITSANVYRFFQFFIIQFWRKLSMCRWQKLPFQLNYVATLPCEIWKFKIPPNYITCTRKNLMFTWNLTKLHKVQNISATKYYRNDWLDFCIIYNVQNAH